MSKFCIICSRPLTGGQRKLCSDRECHRKRKRERSLKYRQNTQEKIKERNREYYQNNSEREKGRRRAWYQNNREYAKERDHKRYQNNSERAKENSRIYRLNNPKKIKEYNQKHYRLSRGLPEDWNLSRESSIEIIMKRWLQESDVEFVQHYFINFENTTWTHVDFFIPEANVCLYCDGDYWHGPKRPDIQERDARINKALEEMGYGVVRMTETEILEGNRPWWIGELIPAKW